MLEWLHGWVVTVDHKRLGILYVVYAIFFLLVAGAEALADPHPARRGPDNHFFSPEVYNELFTMHGTTMVFLVGMPIIFGFANYLVPLMIGARDMAFPRLNAFSFWMTAFGGLLLYYSFIGGFGLYGMGTAPDVGWWAYAPLTAKAFSPGHATDYWALALIVSGFGTLGTAINIIATTLSMRCRGMTPDAHAAVCLAHAGGQRAHPRHHHAAHRGADHAAHRPLSGRPFLRYAGGRLGRGVDALLLDLRPSRSLRAGHAGLRHRQRNYSRLFAQGDLRLSRHGRGVGRASRSSASACGRTTCSRSA